MKLLTFGAVVAATVILVPACFIEGHVDLAAITVGFSLIWIIGIWRGWDWSAFIGFISMTGAVAFGAGLGMSPVGMLVALTATLVAWDLHRFLLRHANADHVIDESNLQIIHLRRLAIVVAVGLVLGILALSLEFNLGLGWVILMGLVVAVGLSWIVGYVRRSEKV